MKFRPLEDADFDAQEFFGILTEVADEQTQVASEAGEIVIKLWVGEELARGGGVVVEFGGGGGEVGAGVAEFVVKRVVSGEFAEGTLSGANVADQTVGISNGLLRFLVEKDRRATCRGYLFPRGGR